MLTTIKAGWLRVTIKLQNDNELYNPNNDQLYIYFLLTESVVRHPLTDIEQMFIYIPHF